VKPIRKRRAGWLGGREVERVGVEPFGLCGFKWGRSGRRGRAAEDLWFFED
jgi:hypothetical protein